VRVSGSHASTAVEAWDPDTRTGTGFVFDRFDAGDCLRAVESALAALADPVQRAVLMRNAMTTDFSWKRSASQYVRVYERLLSGRSRHPA